jgi:DNA-binding NarL/FixJ family response regulator
MTTTRVSRHKLPFVWVVEKNPLAAEYLLQLIGRTVPSNVRWVNETIRLSKEELGDSPLFVIDTAGLEGLVTEYMREMNTHFGDAKYIIVHTPVAFLNVSKLLALGGRGFLLYEDVTIKLGKAIRSVLGGGVWINPSMFKHEVGHCLPSSESSNIVPKGQIMTLRESEISQLVMQRLSNKEISLTLRIEVSTVKFHLSNIYSKLQIDNRSGIRGSSSMGSLMQNRIDNNSPGAANGKSTPSKRIRLYGDNIS